MRLHKLIKKRRPKIVLEFGCGNSTLAMAEALKSKTRLIYAVETSQEWADLTKEALPEHLKARVIFSVTPARITMHEGQLCHKFESLPDIVPNFIYLDGPDPCQVEGSIDGLSFKSGQRGAIAADPLYYESSFKKGFMMLVDGRENGFHFLKRNLKRAYKVKKDVINSVEYFWLK